MLKKRKKVIEIHNWVSPQEEIDFGFESLETIAAQQPWWEFLLPSPKPVLPEGFQFLSGDIWGHDFPRSKWSFLNGLILCIALLFTAVTTDILTMNMIRDVPKKPTKEHYVLIAPIFPTPPVNAEFRKKSIMKSGGGGGNHATLPASKGRLPKPAAGLTVPPTTQPPEKAKLILPPFISEIKLDFQNIKLQFGDPIAPPAPPSDGMGAGGGIGSGSGGGIGPGRGPGYGSGRGGGIAGRQFIPATGISAPTLVSRVSPRYTREAYDAGIQGVVVLEVVITAEGRVHVSRVIQGLGMGLNEKAREAAEQWRFKPAEKDGESIAITGRLELYFRK